MDWRKPLGSPVTIGLLIGVAIGIAMENIAIGVAIGLALGGGMTGTCARRPRDGDDRSEGGVEDPTEER